MSVDPAPVLELAADQVSELEARALTLPERLDALEASNLAVVTKLDLLIALLSEGVSQIAPLVETLNSGGILKMIFGGKGTP